jgi:hypothetical protein
VKFYPRPAEGKFFRAAIEMKSCDLVAKAERESRLKGKGLENVEKRQTAPSRNSVPAARTQHHVVLAHIQGRLCLAAWIRFTEASPQARSSDLSAVGKISLAVFARRWMKKSKCWVADCRKLLRRPAEGDSQEDNEPLTLLFFRAQFHLSAGLEQSLHSSIGALKSTPS